MAAVALFVLPGAIGFYTDWLWFQEVGYTSVFLRTINAQAVVFLLTFALAYAFLALNLRVARTLSSRPRPRIVIGMGADGRPISVDAKRAVGMAVPIAVVVSGVLAVINASQWLTWLNYLHASSFGVADPLFGRDVSYFVFELPVQQIVRRQLLTLGFVALIGTAGLYLFSGSFVIESTSAASWPKLRLVPRARLHLSLLVAMILALMAWGAWLEIPGTLLSPTDARVAFGASYADVYARIPFLRAVIVVLVAGAGLSIWHGFGRRAWPLPLAIAAYFIVTMTGGLYAGAIQRLVVTPNEQEKERPFIEHNIALTRQAYALERVEERNLSGDEELTADDIVNNALTIENVRLWDHDQLLQTFGQIQVIRPYYDFRSIDNDRYTIDGKYRQVMLSARELNTQNMPNRSWVNERLMFTHGYGLTLGPVNQVTTEGLPVLFVRDLPPISTVDLPVSQPSIYFGELTNDYVLVKTRQPEFHYPRGDDNEMTSYDGPGGVSIGSLWRRIVFAIRFASTDILVTNQLTPESRVMYYRNIVERVRQIAPFLTLDADPYPVVSEGRVIWVQDAYTTSSNYPYATPNAAPGALSGVNYIRNSVKVTIDAFDGAVRFYLAEPDDPLATTLSRIFPGMLKPMAEMPEDLRAHVRYPEDIFLIQAEKYATYHMTNPQVFYNNEDEWRRPVLESGSGQNQRSALMEPYYTIMKLPGNDREEFLQMLPFTPRARDNLAAWMVARSDGENYGRLLVYQFPKQKIIYGPAQIVARINQDPVITPQITLWSQQGSQVIQGTLLVIPIEESLLYVRPLYLRSQQGRIPELKQVIVAYQNRIVMAETLVTALGRIFGPTVTKALAPDRLSSAATSVVETVASGEMPDAAVEGAMPAGPAPPEPEAAITLQELAVEAQQHLDAAGVAQRAGNWAVYGEEMKRLQEVITRMQDVGP